MPVFVYEALNETGQEVRAGERFEIGRASCRERV